MGDCIFCRIASGELPSKTLRRDDDLIAIEDVNPQAPAHELVMPVRHYETIGELVATDPALAARLLAAASQLGAERGGEGGFRLVVNTGRDGGQTVAHVHVHVLSGRVLGWPPG